MGSYLFTLADSAQIDMSGRKVPWMHPPTNHLVNLGESRSRFMSSDRIPCNPLTIHGRLNIRNSQLRSITCTHGAKIMYMSVEIRCSEQKAANVAPGSKSGR